MRSWGELICWAQITAFSLPAAPAWATPRRVPRTIMSSVATSSAPAFTSPITTMEPLDSTLPPERMVRPMIFVSPRGVAWAPAGRSSVTLPPRSVTVVTACSTTGQARRSATSRMTLPVKASRLPRSPFSTLSAVSSASMVSSTPPLVPRVLMRRAYRENACHMMHMPGSSATGIRYSANVEVQLQEVRSDRHSHVGTEATVLDEHHDGNLRIIRWCVTHEPGVLQSLSPPVFRRTRLAGNTYVEPGRAPQILVRPVVSHHADHA